jgi:hypothetical protein
MLALVSMQGAALTRRGYVLATTNDALTNDLVTTLVSVCPYLVSRAAGSLGAGSAIYASGRRA